MLYADYINYVDTPISEADFNKINSFTTLNLLAICQKLVPYWKHEEINKVDLNRELAFLINHVANNGGENYYSNIDNFITEAKTGAFSYKIDKGVLTYDNLPINPALLINIKTKLRLKGLLKCGI